MYYGLSDSKAKWILMRGWEGCQIGQGNIIFSDLEEWQLNQIYDALIKRNPPKVINNPPETQERMEE